MSEMRSQDAEVWGLWVLPGSAPEKLAGQLASANYSKHAQRDEFVSSDIPNPAVNSDLPF